MADTAWTIKPLEPKWALSFGTQAVGHVTVKAVPHLALISLAFDADNAASVAAKLGIKHLSVGASQASQLAATTPDETWPCRFAMLQPGQIWLMAETAPSELMAQAQARFGGHSWLTDQTDGWVAISVLADDEVAANAVMARLCMLDVATIKIDTATRTLVAHLSVIIIKEGAGHYTLLAPRSSAQHLHHMVTLAAQNAG
ncbi:MAG: hypothetical protein AAGH82_09965 [Pseudomonadota bacterium]